MKRLFLLCGLMLVFRCSMLAGNIYLVSIGITDYPGTKNDLRLPAKDALTIQGVYDRNGKATTVALVNSQATKARIKEYVDRLFSKAGKNDVIVLFFSGHGYKGGFVAYDSFLSYDEIRTMIAKSHAGGKIVLADACFSGKMRTKGRVAHGSLRNGGKDELMFFLSSRDDETSIERADMKNGFFTSCLQKALRGEADANRDRAITARELFNYVSVGVKRLSRNRQHPVMWGRFDDTLAVMSW